MPSSSSFSESSEPGAGAKTAWVVSIARPSTVTVGGVVSQLSASIGPRISNETGVAFGSFGSLGSDS